MVLVRLRELKLHPRLAWHYRESYPHVGLGLTTGLDTNEAFFLDSVHLNPAGNALPADKLAQKLAELPNG